MQPKVKPTLAQTQRALVEAVRQGNTDPLNGYAPNRLAVYARLVRNNTFGFVDRCFVEAQWHISPEQWLQTKELFVREGKAHSPYFQDIAGEFLTFCQARNLFSENILALMDFENTQLLAEVSQAQVPSEFEWDSATVMQFSDAAYLKNYEVDFLSTDFAIFTLALTQVLVWRDSDFDVNYQALTELDFWLLSYLQEQASALDEVLTALKEVVEDCTHLIPILEQIWRKWINAEVIYPQTN